MALEEIGNTELQCRSADTPPEQAQVARTTRLCVATISAMPEFPDPWLDSLDLYYLSKTMPHVATSPETPNQGSHEGQVL